MNESNQPSQTGRRSDFRYLPSIFVKPRQTFTELTSGLRVVWLAPMLVLTLSAILVVVVSGVMRSRAAANGTVELPQDWQYWSQEMQDNYMQAQQSRQGPLFMYVLPLLGSLVSLWMGWVVFSGLLHLVSTILGGRGSLRGTLNVVAWASLPYLIRDLLRMIYMLAASSAISSPGLSGFAGGTGFLSSMLARTDVFLIWYILLLGIGAAISEGLPRGKAFAGVVVLVLAVLLIQAGIGALGSNLGLSVVSRPYF